MDWLAQLMQDSCRTKTLPAQRPDVRAFISAACHALRELLTGCPQNQRLATRAGCPCVSVLIPLLRSTDPTLVCEVCKVRPRELRTESVCGLM